MTTQMLNPQGDAPCAQEIIDSLRKELKAAEEVLTTTRLDAFSDYTAAYSRAQALRKALGAAEKIFGRRFKI